MQQDQKATETSTADVTDFNGSDIGDYITAFNETH